jgi:D-serine dehydratase
MRPIDDRRFKGLPLPVGMPLTRIGDLGWNALRDLEYPALVLHEERLVHNITMMADYCHDHRVELAPHAKTSLSPQLIRRQMEAGAWGATAATAAQVRGLLAVGVPRILLANLLVDPVAIRWIVTHVLRQGNTGFSCYVDSMASVELLDRECGQADPAGPLDVLLEVGYLGGRTGVRSLEESLAVARAVNQSKHLCLVGVAGYEGLMPGAAAGEPAGLEAYLESIRSDRSRAECGRPFRGRPSATGQRRRQLVLRPGRRSSRSSPLWLPGADHSAKRLLPDPRPRHLSAHLALRWAQDPDRATITAGVRVVGQCAVPARADPCDRSFGRRDAPFDDQLPVVLGRYGHDCRRSDAPGVRVTKLNDQHAFLQVPDELQLGLGEVWSFGVSHPCGAFDRWPAIPLVDSGHQIVGAVTTDL